MGSGPDRDPGDEGDHGAAREIDWEDFRDHLTTADQEGHRKWIYPKKPAGRWYRRRTWVSWVLLAVMFGGPFVRINGHPLLMVNILERKFSILGRIFWPEDSILFALAMLAFLTGIIVFTTAFGRLWCGWTCPQTLLMEMVFRKIEYAIEGDALEQRALDAAPWTWRKVLKKGGKHLIFLGLSFLIGNTLLSYIIGTDQLYAIVTDPPSQHLAGLGFMMLFTLLFYSIFARFREQACTFICPYGRFQSAMIDENTLVVAYDHKRGETRAPLHRGQTLPQRQAAGHGDCIACRQCVVVCPTGIDIRNGLQMECVHCTACIDACDAIMDKIHRPRGLIRYASLNTVERGQPMKFTPRMAIYSGVLAVLIGVFVALVVTRADVETLLLRAPGALYQQTARGTIQNLYTLKVVNKSSRDIPLELRLENHPGRLTVMGGALVVPKEDLAKTSVLIEVESNQVERVSTPLTIGVYSHGEKLETVRTVFIGPRSRRPSPSNPQP